MKRVKERARERGPKYFMPMKYSRFTSGYE